MMLSGVNVTAVLAENGAPQDAGASLDAHPFSLVKDVDFSEIHPFNRPPTENSFDVLHISGGTQINIGKSHFVLGLQWSGGSDSGKSQLANINPGPEDGTLDPPLQGPIQNELNVFFRSLAFIFGIDVNLNPEE